MSVMKPEEHFGSFVEKFNSGDVESVLSLYEQDAAVVPQQGQAVFGLDAIRQTLLEYLAVGKLTGKIRYCIQVGDVALASASWQIKGIGPDGEPVVIQGNSAALLRRQADGRWLLVVDHPLGGTSEYSLS